MARVLFVPYALFDRDAYAAKARRRFEQMGLELDSVHDAPEGPVRAVEKADALFIGGGNSFRLLNALWREKLIEPIRDRAAQRDALRGHRAPARTSRAPRSRRPTTCRSCEPPTFEALDLVPFNINPHYQDPDPGLDAHGRDARAADR